MNTYSIIRIYRSDLRHYVVKTGVTFDEAYAHFRDPENSSKTCTSIKGKRRTSRYGEWFDIYEIEAY